MRALFVTLGLAALSAPALACVCSPPETDQQKREIAERIAANAIAIVDVEQVAPMDFSTMRGETYRVAKIHLGTAPQRFELDRNFHREPGGQVSLGMTSCDEIPPPGRTTTVVLYSVPGSEKYRFGGTCDQYFVNEVPGAVAMIRASVARPVERG